MRVVEKFGPFPFGEPAFGEWPQEPDDGEQEIDGPAWPPGLHPSWVTRYRGHGRVRVRVRSRRNQDDIEARWHGVGLMNPAVPSRLAVVFTGVVQASNVHAPCGRAEARRADGGWYSARGLVRGDRFSKTFVGVAHSVKRRYMPTVKVFCAAYVEHKRAEAETRSAIAAVITAMRPR